MLDLDNESKIWCFVFITLFNLQGARRSAQLIDITTSFFPCQELFSSFFKLFKALSFAGITFSCINQAVELGRRSRSDLISLPLAFRFVKNFFQVFQTFFKFLQPKQLVDGALSSARLSYQTQQQLSTLFTAAFFTKETLIFQHFITLCWTSLSFFSPQARRRVFAQQRLAFLSTFLSPEASWWGTE